MLVLSRQLDTQVDETRRFDQLDKTAQCDQLRRVHLDLGEAWDQTVCQLVIP